MERGTVLHGYYLVVSSSPNKLASLIQYIYLNLKFYKKISKKYCNSIIFGRISQSFLVIFGCIFELHLWNQRVENGWPLGAPVPQLAWLSFELFNPHTRFLHTEPGPHQTSIGPMPISWVCSNSLYTHINIINYDINWMLGSQIDTLQTSTWATNYSRNFKVINQVTWTLQRK